MVLLVVFIVLMILWPVLGVYVREPGKPYGLAGTLIPWICVLILGLVVFKAFPEAPPAAPPASWR